METLIMGPGTMPVPEMHAAVDEILAADPEASFNVLPERSEFVGQVMSYIASRVADRIFEWEDSVQMDKVLLLESDEMTDTEWDFLESVAEKGARVFAFNKQMYEMVPPEDEYQSAAHEDPETYEPATEQEAVDHFNAMAQSAAEGMTPVEQPSNEEIAEEAPETYTVTDGMVLDEMSIPELKRVAEGLGVEPEGDKRAKQSWIDAITPALQPRLDAIPEAAPEFAPADNLNAFMEAEKNDATEDNAELVSALTDAAQAIMRAVAILEG